MALVPDQWGSRWQVRGHVLTRLARRFHVLWMNPALGWRQRLSARASDDSPADRNTPEGFQVYTPEPWLPTLYRPAALARWSSRERLHRARRRLLARGARRIVLYLWRPDFASALSADRYDLSCYHIDDEYTFSPIDIPISDSERSLIRAVDQVFIHSPGLMEKKGGINPHTDFVPLGVDYERYATPVPEPPELAGIPRPRIGYIGVLKKTLDWPLLLFLSERRPDWSFVFMGPRGPHSEIDEPIRELASRPNVHFLAERATREIGPFPQHLDVCIMPYVADDYARYGYPLKLHEYLAGGRPVVGTRMRTLEDFTNVVALATGREDWLARIAAALSPDERTPARIAARRAVARAHDWEALVEQIGARMAERLGGEVKARYEATGGVRTTPPDVSSRSATPLP